MTAKELCHEFLIFGLKQARACVFAGSFFILLFVSNHFSLGLPRYDFLLIGALLIQIVLVVFKIETLDELKTICVFHVIGLVLELYKTSPEIAAWSYPEFAYTKVLTVPLYSGFMYAAVASYIIQAWRIHDLKFRNYPPYIYSIPLCVAIYMNFFTRHFLPDVRWLLIPLVFIIFYKTMVDFTVIHRDSKPVIRTMPLSLSFLLIGFFIWVAENISTFLGAWQYPHQTEEWTIVHSSTVTSWFLLVIISVIIVADLKQFKERRS